jgi:hypothetical protein
VAEVGWGGEMQDSSSSKGRMRKGWPIEATAAAPKGAARDRQEQEKSRGWWEEVPRASLLSNAVQPRNGRLTGTKLGEKKTIIKFEQFLKIYSFLKFSTHKVEG